MQAAASARCPHGATNTFTAHFWNHLILSPASLPSPPAVIPLPPGAEAWHPWALLEEPRDAQVGRTAGVRGWDMQVTSKTHGRGECFLAWCWEISWLCYCHGACLHPPFLTVCSAWDCMPCSEGKGSGFWREAAEAIESQSYGIVKAGKDLYDHLVQPLTQSCQGQC